MKINCWKPKKMEKNQNINFKHNHEKKKYMVNNICVVFNRFDSMEITITMFER